MTTKETVPGDEQRRQREFIQAGSDLRAEVLEPQPDVLLYLEVPDELLKYYLSLSRASGMVYALAVKQLINRLYRDHDYVRRRKLEGRRTAYDTAVERDSQALAWLIAAAALYVPDEVKRHPIPPRPPKPVRRTPRSDKAAKAKARASVQAQASQATPGPLDALDALGAPPVREDAVGGGRGGGGAGDERDTVATVRALLDAAQTLQAARDVPADGPMPPGAGGQE